MDPLSEMPITNLEPQPFIDLHEDLLLHIQERKYFGDHWQTDFPMLERANAKIVVVSAFPAPADENYFDPRTLEMIEADFKTYLARTRVGDGWNIIRESSDLSAIMADRELRGLILHIEGLNVLPDPLWQKLEEWYRLGWRSLGLVWNLTNPLGGGTNDTKTTLTPLGRELVAWLSAHRMIIDYAHMNAPTFQEVASITSGPIVVSHGNARACCESPRNYDDRQLKLIAERGGVIGVFFAKTYVSGRKLSAGIEDLIRHIEHLRRVMGIDHIALGTDFGGISSGLVSGLASVEAMPAFFQALRAHGYTEEMIEKIAWKNAARVLAEILSKK